MEYLDLSYIFGLSTMFFGMLTWFFWRRGELLYRLVALLTGAIAIEYIKDFIAVRIEKFSIFKVLSIILHYNGNSKPAS